eukprot:NODE_530_length_1392_cov_16.283794_g495_i0.p1 GENE.NODE_530_length_1392_cov_16.283794_g495_i0~~NODE_530_length_1392_cov_16.283794_g495_i0.p1  ORF type:complete len:398 (+),score=121.23 NODE_530_length_1392_cov_16.283794_g495_i0:77-1270(+)
MLRRMNTTQVARQQVRYWSEWATGKEPVLFLGVQGHNIEIKEHEWVRLLHDCFGVPLNEHYHSRYPGFSDEDVEVARSKLQGSFNFTGEWEAKYASLNCPEEMTQCRNRLEAELDPTNVEKLQKISGDNYATDCGFAALRLRSMADAAKRDREYGNINASRGEVTIPEFDWKVERASGPTYFEKRVRYARLAASSITWDPELPEKWLKAYTASADVLQKDVDIDYLRYLEGHIRDQFRAEKWYQRLAEDGEETLTHEEVEAWMPEYYDTLMIDYDNWWELVQRNTEQSNWDRYSSTDAQYQAQVKEQFEQQQEIADDQVACNDFFAPDSPFQAFRDVPKVDFNFLAAETTDPYVKQLCLEAAKTQAIAPGAENKQAEEVFAALEARFNPQAKQLAAQ